METSFESQITHLFIHLRPFIESFTVKRVTRKLAVLSRLLIWAYWVELRRKGTGERLEWSTKEYRSCLLQGRTCLLSIYQIYSPTFRTCNACFCLFVLKKMAFYTNKLLLLFKSYIFYLFKSQRTSSLSANEVLVGKLSNFFGFFLPNCPGFVCEEGLPVA